MEIISARRITYLHIKRQRVGHDSWWLQHWKLCTFLINKLKTKIVSNCTHASVIAAKIPSDLSVLDIMVMWSMPTIHACESFNKTLRSKRVILFTVKNVRKMTFETKYNYEEFLVENI